LIFTEFFERPNKKKFLLNRTNLLDFFVFDHIFLDYHIFNKNKFLYFNKNNVLLDFYFKFSKKSKMKFKYYYFYYVYDNLFLLKKNYYNNISKIY